MNMNARNERKKDNSKVKQNIKTLFILNCKCLFGILVIRESTKQEANIIRVVYFEHFFFSSLTRKRREKNIEKHFHLVLILRFSFADGMDVG